MNQHHAASHPPFCPNRHCDTLLRGASFRWKRAGWYRRENPPHRVQRFRCFVCAVFFSRQSFAAMYWLKRPELLPIVFRRLHGCCLFRPIAPDLGVGHETVARLAARLGRPCLLFHGSHRPRAAPTEARVLDGLRGFECRQWHPRDLNLLVGSASRFTHAVNEAELPRNGRIWPEQLRKRARLEERHGRPDPQAIEKAVAELVAEVVPPGGEVLLLTDRRPADPRAWRRIPDRSIRHVRISSERPRRPDNPLDPVDEADRFIRHGQAKHVGAAP